MAGPGGSFNEYGSEGPTFLNEPPELAQLFEGTTVIHLSLMSGEPVEESVYGLTGTLRLDCPIDSLLAAGFASTVSRHLRIPSSCVTFIWGPAHVDWATGEMSVSLTMQLCEQDYDDSSSHPANLQLCSMDSDYLLPTTCCICTWPCADADEDGPDARGRNCAVCEPCFLCPACSLHLKDGSSRCLQCISQEELTLIDSAQVQIWRGRDADLVRRRVLNPEIRW